MFQGWGGCRTVGVILAPWPLSLLKTPNKNRTVVVPNRTVPYVPVDPLETHPIMSLIIVFPLADRTRSRLTRLAEMDSAF